jgi:hypothetical protein
MDYSFECGYLSKENQLSLFNDYENIIGKIVKMINHPGKWSF